MRMNNINKSKGKLREVKLSFLNEQGRVYF